MPLRYKFCAYAIVRLLKRSRLISVAADYTCGLGLSSDHGAYFFDRGGGPDLANFLTTAGRVANWAALYINAIISPVATRAFTPVKATPR
jgi:hypothetical protein